MNATKDRFWAKVLFKEFIRHYRKMTPEQKVADIDESMDALEELDDSGDSFGAKMVRWSMERVEQYPMARENGKKGGRPRKNPEDNTTPEISTDGPRQAEARQNQGRTGGGSARGTGCSIVPPVRSSGPMPANVQKVYDFASSEGLDHDDAYECWYVTTVERNGNDADGNPVTNWKPFLKKWCNTRKTKRSA